MNEILNVKGDTEFMELFILLLVFLLLLLVLIGTAIIVSIIILVVIKRHFYQQVGPTCGFFALVYAISRIELIKKKKVVREIIIDYVKNKKSNVGEIFDIYIMKEILDEYFPSVEANVVNIDGIESLDKYLENHYVIYPCNPSGTPHYYFVERYTKFHYVYCHNYFFFKRKMKKEVLFQQHIELEKVPVYRWNDYYQGKASIIEKINLWYNDSMKFFADPKLYLFLRKIRKERKEGLYDKKTEINMYGKILVIKKPN